MACSIPDCGKSVRAGGLCSRHYRALQTNAVQPVLSGNWRDRVVDPAWLVQCVCLHYEQIHAVLHGRCTANCICDGFVEKRRERV